MSSTLAGHAATRSPREHLIEALGSDPDARDVIDRFDRWGADLASGLAEVYPSDITARIVTIIAEGHRARPAHLRARDRQRLLRPDWIQEPHMLGYAAYTDRFAGDLRGVGDAIAYLSELGVTYLHLMPLLQPRPEPNDGGYAVADYRTVRSDLGTIDDLAQLADDLHAAGISLTLDLVLNHVAREHAWAAAARAGDRRYLDYFHTFADRQLPDLYEQTLLEVFPDFAPGSFTWDDEVGRWVWTTFNEWQWDLNWANPDVLCEFAEIILFLANRGVDCLRLDAIAFMWKRMGTVCQNEPEVHAITQVLRAVARIAAPALVLKAEAIVAPDELVAYLGTGRHAGRVSDLAYHNSLMVQIWSALAAGDARMVPVALSRFPAIPTTTAWVTYLRCHDDIGWAIDDADAAAVGWNGPAHRSFLASYYAGEFPGSDAEGADFQANPVTGDRRTSGTSVGLLGIESALKAGDSAAVSVGIDRMLCAYAMVMGHGGIPLIWMGDEIGLGTDETYLSEPGLREDNRWMHRPWMDWSLAALRKAPESVPGRLWSGLRRIISARAACDSLHAATPTEVEVADDPAALLFIRRHAAGSMVQVYNVANRDVAVEGWRITRVIADPWDLLAGEAPDLSAGRLVLRPYAAMWLVDRDALTATE